MASVTVVVGDGVEGWLSEAPYDRIMATASLSTLPVAWVKQLRPGGKLVMDLQATLASGFLVVEKTSEGKVSGSLLPEPLHFMLLQTERVTVPSVQKTELLRQPCHETFVLDYHAIFPDILFDPAFRWFLQWNIAGCQIRRDTQPQDDHPSGMQAIVIKDSAHNALVRFQKGPGATHWQGKVYGNLLSGKRFSRCMMCSCTSENRQCRAISSWSSKMLPSCSLTR